MGLTLCSLPAVRLITKNCSFEVHKRDLLDDKSAILAPAAKASVWIKAYIWNIFFC